MDVLCITCWIIASSLSSDVMAFTPSPSMMVASSSSPSEHPPRRPSSRQRRKLIGSIGTATATAVGSGNTIFSGLPFWGNNKKANAAELGGTTASITKGGGGPTNEVVKVVNGMKHRRLGNSDIVVSELGLGTQRWMSSDYNAPDKDLCYEFMDDAILKRGVNFLDTAEQYPIPASNSNTKEGDTERVIGDWMQDRKVPREKVVIATKITGATNVTPKNIQVDLDGSLKRLQTEYVDVYLLHWPQRYSPQSNWGQSLQYDQQYDQSWRKQLGPPTSFEALCIAMETQIQAGKIRGWGLCNDNAYGVTACTRTAKALGTTPPCAMQGDFSVLDRKSEENGVAEAISPFNENVGFMAYNALAGGMLTGKYSEVPAAADDTDRRRATASFAAPRGRMDTRGWGGTLYRYRTEAAQEAIRQYQALATQHQLTLTELSLRWCKQRDMITTTLVGHTNTQQLDETIHILTTKQDLSPELMWEIDRIHMKNRLPLFTNSNTGSDWFNEGVIGERIP